MRAAAMHTFDLTTDVLAAQSGDETAFSRLITHYQNAAGSVAMAIVRNAAASQDIAQAAFVAAWQKLRTLRQPESFGPWLLQLVRNEALKSLRTDKRRFARDGKWHSEQPSTGPDAAALLDERTMYANLYTALDEVPDDCREILLLYYREGRSSEQVAELLSLSSAAVRKRLERAREVLRDRFEKIEEAAKKTAPPAGFAALVIAAIHASSAAAATGGVLAMKGALAWLTAAAVLIGGVFLWQTRAPEKQAVTVAKSASKPTSKTRLAPSVTGVPVRDAANTQTWATGDDDVFSRPPLSALPAFSVSGRVLTSQGEPVSGATVVFSLEDGAKRFVSNARGEYAGQLPRGVYRPSVVTGELSAARPQLFVNADQAGVDFVLGDPARIDGLVRDENGKPLRAHVVLSPHEHSGEWTKLDTSEDGTFSATGLSPGSYDVAAFTDDRVETPAEQGITVLPGGSYFAELSFKAAARVTAKLVDDTGAPMVGYVVEIGHGDARVRSQSQEDGSVAVPRALPLGKNRVTVFEPGEDNEIDRGRGFSTTRILWGDNVNNDGKAMQIVVPRMGELQIEAPGIDARYLHLNRIESIGGWIPEQSRVAAFDDKQTVSARLPAGVWHLIASNSYDTASSPHPMPVKVKAGRTEHLVFTTRPSVDHVIRVLEPNGQPARGAMVADDHQQWVANDDGVIPDLSPRAYPFTARATQWGRGVAFTIPDEKTKELTVTLQPAATLRGSVDGVGPNETIAVSVSGPDEHWFMQREPLRFMGKDFVLDDVPAGAVTVEVKTSSGVSGEAKLTIAPGEAASVNVTLGVSAGIEGSITIDGEPPAPLPLVTVDDKSPVHVGGGEHFVFKHLTPGKHVVRVSVYGEVIVERTVETAPGETVKLFPFLLDAKTFKKPRVFQVE